MSIDGHTRLAALLGDPVAHSRSPRIHNAAFAAQRVNAVYLALQVTGEALPDAVAGLRAMDFLGANVTIPHKEAVLPLMDSTSEAARAVGAVNTIVVRDAGDGRRHLHGDNTDVAGFLAPLQAHAEALHGAEMVVFGAGGAARAVVYGLLTTYAPTRLTLAVRTPARAQALARHLAPYDDTRGALRVQPLAEAGPAVRAARLLVNATPVGMPPAVDATPWPQTDDFSPGQLAYDLLYHPAPTRFLRDAAARGAGTLDGLPMLVEQAAAAYAQWTGRQMPHDVVYAALSPTLS